MIIHCLGYVCSQTVAVVPVLCSFLPSHQEDSMHNILPLARVDNVRHGGDQKFFKQVLNYHTAFVT